MIIYANSMGKTPDRQIIAECNQIRRLLDDKDHKWSDLEIIEKLGITQATYYRRKKKIAEIDKELWLSLQREPYEKGILDIFEAMKKCHDLAAKIRDSDGSEDKDRIAAGQLAIKARVFMYHLLHGKGPISPNEIDNLNEQVKSLESKRLVQ